VESVREIRLHVALPEGIGWVDLLVARARQGDLAAFEQLAERYLPEAYRLAAAMVGPDDARDVAQDSLVAAWRELPTLKHVDRFESWLRSIVMNRARNTLRRRRRHPTVALIDSHATAMVHEPMAATERRLEVQDALDGLSSEQREVLALHYLVGLPIREVAEVLGLREGTAKSRLHSGLMALRARSEA
jgi:RNA polymerase sigma-70 factor (ECF subfamily)